MQAAILREAKEPGNLTRKALRHGGRIFERALLKWVPQMRASTLPLEAIIGSRALGERAGWTGRGNRDLKCSVRVPIQEFFSCA